MKRLPPINFFALLIMTLTCMTPVSVRADGAKASADAGASDKLDEARFHAYSTAEAIQRSWVSVRSFGARGDDKTDDTKAIQDAINHSKNTLIPAGVFKVTSSISVPSGHTITGLGKGNTSVIHAVGCTALTLKTVNYSDNTIIRDLSLRGDNGKDMSVVSDHHGIYAPDTGRETFELLIENVSIKEFKGRGIYLPNEFSSSIRNVSVDYCSDNAIEVEGANTTLLESCYVHNVAVGKVAYRIYATGTIINCNGIDTGGDWGLFGQNMAEDGVDNVSKVTLIGCNIEDFADTGIRYKYYGHASISGCSFLAKPAGTFRYYIRLDYGDTFPVISCSFYSKGSTSSAVAPLYGGNMLFISSNSGTPVATTSDGVNVLAPATINSFYSSYKKYAVRLNNAYFDNVDYMKLRGKRITNGTAPPNTGSWAQGDICYNSTPSPGEFVGWICVAEGAPGQWRGFGAIEP